MRIKILIAVAAIAFGAAVPAASAADRAPSKVTIKHLGGGEFQGKVKSDDDDCVADRKVVLYKVTKSGAKKIGSDTTDDNGKWNSGQTGYKKGKFYAKVKKSEDCAKATSKTIKVTP